GRAGRRDAVAGARPPQLVERRRVHPAGRDQPDLTLPERPPGASDRLFDRPRRRPVSFATVPLPRGAEDRSARVGIEVAGFDNTGGDTPSLWVCAAACPAPDAAP